MNKCWMKSIFTSLRESREIGNYSATTANKGTRRKRDSPLSLSTLSRFCGNGCNRPVDEHERRNNVSLECLSRLKIRRRFTRTITDRRRNFSARVSSRARWIFNGHSSGLPMSTCASEPALFNDEFLQYFMSPRVATPTSFSNSKRRRYRFLFILIPNSSDFISLLDVEKEIINNNRGALVKR